jgi:hypothetical protein
MSVQTDHPLLRRPISHLDRHAIGVAGRLLTMGVWLECRLMGTAKRGTTFIERPSWSQTAGRLLQMSISNINQPRNEEP